MKKFWEWLVKSSANASQTSLTVKAFLYGIIPGILLFTKAFNLDIGGDQLTAIVDGIVAVIAFFGSLISAIAIVIGLVRKLWLTVIGKNSVVAGWSYKD